MEYFFLFLLVNKVLESIKKRESYGPK